MIVLRAGDVIPQVVSPAPHVVEQKGRPRRPRPPARCPFCDTPTIKPEGAVFTQVPQPRLSRARVAAAQALRLARRDGHRRARREAGRAAAGARARCATAADFYRLSEEQLLELEGFGEISARNLLAAIEASKQRPFARVLFALGIEEVGEVTGRNLAQRFRDIDALLEADARADRPRRPASARRWPRSIRAQLARRAHARADRRPARARAALRRGGPGAVGGAARRQDARADRHAAATGRASRRPSGSWPPAGASPARCRRRPTTSSPARARARSSRRPSAWACRCSTRRLRGAGVEGAGPRAQALAAAVEARDFDGACRDWRA